MRRTEALASVKFYQILSIFIFFIRLIILEDFIRLISYNGPCVRLGCSFFLATALKVAKESKSCPRLLVLQRVAQNAKSCLKVAEDNLFMPTFRGFIQNFRQASPPLSYAESPSPRDLLHISTEAFCVWLKALRNDFIAAELI